MTVVSILVADETNPVELQAWFNNNPNVSIFEMLNDGRTFFIIYS